MAIIWKSGPEDAGSLFELMRELARYEQLDPPDEAALARLQNDLWGPRPRAEAWLASPGSGQPAVAYAVAFETYSTFLALPTFYLEDLFVRESHRRTGLGREFFRFLAREADRRGCGRMEWSCLHWNEPAIRFYTKLGARRREDWIAFRLTSEELTDLARTPLLDV